MESSDFHEVQKAKHYNTHPSGVEAIEICRYMTGCMFNAFKYVWRAGEKDTKDTQKDLDKALYYLRDELEHRPFRDLANNPLLEKVVLMGEVSHKDTNHARGMALQAIFDAALYKTEYRLEVAIATVHHLKQVLEKVHGR